MQRKFPFVFNRANYREESFARKVQVASITEQSLADYCQVPAAERVCKLTLRVSNDNSYLTNRGENSHVTKRRANIQTTNRVIQEKNWPQRL